MTPATAKLFESLLQALRDEFAQTQDTSDIQACVDELNELLGELE